jgi:signal transduction histidine kinase
VAPLISVDSFAHAQRSDVLAAFFARAGASMLNATDTAATATHVAQLVSDILGISHTMVLNALPSGTSLIMQGGVGWASDMVGRAIFDTESNTFTGFTLLSHEPVLIEDLRVEQRFAVPRLLLEHGLLGGICIKIPGQHQPFGMLAAFYSQPRRFCDDEIFCLRVVASMLATSVASQRAGREHSADQQKIAQAKQEWEATVDALPHFVCLLDDQKRIMRANRSVEDWIPGARSDARGHTIHDLLHPECFDPHCYLLTFCDNAWIELRNGRTASYEVDDKRLNRYIGVHLRPTLRHPSGDRKHTSFAVAVVQDITDIKSAEEVLRNSKGLLEQRIQARTAELLRANDQLLREIEERRRIEETLRQSESEMRLMSVQLLTAQEVERKRIAAELHDGIGQSLSAIKFSVESAIGQWGARCNEAEARQLNNIIGMMQGAIEEVRRISMDLHPSTLTDLGIVPTIAWFCREFRSIYSGIHLETSVLLEEANVPLRLKTVMFRIIQEALNNIVKHANASRVRLRLGRVGLAIELVVQDNGRGFDPECLAQRDAKNMGFGITGMRERAEFSGGRFCLTSSPGAGTTVSVSWACLSPSLPECP